jgi:uncharacterized protein DUF3846
VKKPITVLLFKVGQKPEVVEIQNSYESFRDIVGGYIEAVCPFPENICIYCNEEGKLIPLPANRYVPGGFDMICGDFFVCSTNYNTGNNTSLSKKNIEKTLEYFNETF